MTDPVNQKRLLALELLKQTGIWKSNYQPPITNMLWRLGVDVRPPHFMPFFQTALFTGLTFGVIWTLLLVLFSKFSMDGSFIPSTVTSVFAGSLFGFTIASYYAYGRRRHNLPNWESLNHSGTNVWRYLHATSHWRGAQRTHFFLGCRLKKGMLLKRFEAKICWKLEGESHVPLCNIWYFAIP